MLKLRSLSSIAESKIKWIPSTGTYPLGFKVGSIASGVKKSKDLCIIHSTTPCEAAGVFTKNTFCAAPVVVSKKAIKHQVSNLVVNSGCANACTGDEGLQNASKMSQLCDNLLPKGTLVMSTGVIGQHLQMDKISKGIKECASTMGDTHNDVLVCNSVVRSGQGCHDNGYISEAD
jgi:glutamate N-acetyltransferase / amino-acid N-acetyltransferase